MEDKDRYKEWVNNTNINISLYCVFITIKVISSIYFVSNYFISDDFNIPAALGKIIGIDIIFLIAFAIQLYRCLKLKKQTE